MSLWLWVALSMAADVSIPVKLFESRCTLSGPSSRFKAADLTQIDNLSPERVLTFQNVDEAQAAMAQLEKTKAPTPELEPYLTQARVYAKKVALFLGSAEMLRADKNRDRFVKMVSGSPTNRQKKHLEELAGRVLAGEETDVLLASFSETMGAAPDEEFHRAIRRMKINYNCVFDDRGR